MSERKKWDRKYYLKDKLNDAGYPVGGLSLFELEELDKEHKRQSIIKKSNGKIEVQDRIQEIKGEPEPQLTERHPETIDEGDFYKVTRGGLTDREKRIRDDRFPNILEKVRNGYIPTPLELSKYSDKQRWEILKFVSWEPTYGGGSSLIKGRGGYEVDLDGKPIQKKKESKGKYKF